MRFAIRAAPRALVVVASELDDEPEPYMSNCWTSVFHHLGPGWQERAIVARNVSFVGLKKGYQR